MQTHALVLSLGQCTKGASLHVPPPAPTVGRRVPASAHVSVSLHKPCPSVGDGDHLALALALVSSARVGDADDGRGHVSLHRVIDRQKSDGIKTRGTDEQVIIRIHCHLQRKGKRSSGKV